MLANNVDGQVLLDLQDDFSGDIAPASKDDVYKLDKFLNTDF